MPTCYQHKPPRLQAGYFSKFQQDTLFYIFYSMPGDEAQLFAADELSSRGWWYHKQAKVSFPDLVLACGEKQESHSYNSSDTMKCLLRVHR